MADNRLNVVPLGRVLAQLSRLHKRPRGWGATRIVGPDSGACSRCIRRPETAGEGFGRCPHCNLSPTDLNKDANTFDLPFALK